MKEDENGFYEGRRRGGRWLYVYMDLFLWLSFYFIGH